MSRTYGFERPTSVGEVVLTVNDIHTTEWVPMAGQAGIEAKTLWEDAGSTAGLMRLQPGTRLGEHVHRTAVHHAWVTSGACWVHGRRLSAGSYTYVPAGTPHGIDAAEEQGCTFLYLYLREPRV